MTQRRAFVFALLQTAALVAVVALQDPEVRRNVAYALEWSRERALDWLRGPTLPHASDREVSEVIRRAEEIASDAATKGGK